MKTISTKAAGAGGLGIGGVAGFVLGKFSADIMATTHGLIAFVVVVVAGMGLYAFTQYLKHKS